jgi:tungstate transport system permease protein
LKTAILQAFELVISGDAELFNIIGVTLRMSLASSLAALLLGVPLGVFTSMNRFPGRRAFIVLSRTLMGLPPVVCGLICYILFSGVGPLGRFQLLFTVKAMVIAQLILIIPLIVCQTETFLTGIAQNIRENVRGLGLGWGKLFRLTMNECKYQLVSTYFLGFARAIAEVGAVSMVGGAIAWKTNVMTTAIMNYTNRGSFTLGIALGIILLTMSLLLNSLVYFLQERLTK